MDVDGCSGEQNVDRECPCDYSWKDHGKYVSCVAHAAEEQLEADLITPLEKDVIVSTRAKSGCGKKDDLPIYQLPEVITENGAIHMLPAGIFNRGLTVNGNNFFHLLKSVHKQSFTSSPLRVV